MRNLTSLCAIVILFGCARNQESKSPIQIAKREVNSVAWKAVDTVDVASFNKDLVPGKLTLDLGVYFPSNFDPEFKKVTLAQMMKSIGAAKEIYKPAGVQINLLWVKTGVLDPKYFAISSNEVPDVPETEYVNVYEHMQRHPARLTAAGYEAFSKIIEPDPDNARTIYLVVLQDVFFPFLEVSEGRNWTMKTVRTGGMSFPSYSFGTALPQEFRGIITITNLERPDRLRRTVAHELGHKVMNVSHEYKATHPGHEVLGDGGLMLYGSGEEIPSGKEGRWHLERLHLSPFLYRLDKENTKIWNEDYKEGGYYYDPLYGEKVIHFKGKAEIDKDW